MTRLGLEWSASSGLMLSAVAACAALAWHARRRGSRGALLALRAGALAALIAGLLSPTLALRRPRLARPRLLIVLDHSHAMAAPAGAGTRLEAATAWLSRERRRIEQRAEPALFAVAGRAQRLTSFTELAELKPANAAFEPGAALREVAEAQGAFPPERAWLLTDGNAENFGEAERALSALGVPVDVIGVGPARRGRGLAFGELRAPDFAFLHGRINASVVVEAAGLAGEPVRLRLLREERGAWIPLQQSRLRVGSDFDALTATFSATAQGLGSQRYRVEANAGPYGQGPGTAETSSSFRGAAGLSQKRDFRVEVIRQKYRIMYLAGRPSPEYAHLREFLRSDPNHELVSFVILRNPENPTFVPDNELSLIPFPAEEIFIQNLSQFDLFVLENFSYTRFRLPTSYLESLKSFVARGGALLVIGGENAFGLGGYRGTALEELLPVTLSAAAPDFVNGLFAAKPAALSHPLVQLYDDSEASLSAWSALPPLDGWARFQSVRPGATVLATHPSERTADGSPLPLFAIREYGRGKVMLASSDSTWRWRLGAAADWRIATFYARFWTKAVRYLTGTLDLSKVRFAPLPDRLPPREPAVVSLRVFDESFRPAPRAELELSVLWTGPDGKVRETAPVETEPGVYSLELTGLAPGPQRLRANAKLRGRPWGQDELRFSWDSAGAAPPMNRRWLKRAADAAGGSFTELAVSDARPLLERLPPAREESEVRRRLRPWSSPVWLALLLALLLAEWTLRRWRGLP